MGVVRTFYKWWGERALIEVNGLVTSLSNSRGNGGTYKYLGQYNGHSYLELHILITGILTEIRLIADGAYLVVINDEAEHNALGSFGYDGLVGYYSEKVFWIYYTRNLEVGFRTRAKNSI